MQIAHRDIKPDNILLVNNRLKLNDFGCAKTLNKSNNPYVVSQYYRAPELLFGIKEYNTTIDLWATGIILYEFLFKRLPFQGSSEGDQIFEIFSKIGKLKEPTKPKYTNKFFTKDIIQELENILEDNEESFWLDFVELEIDIKEID